MTKIHFIHYMIMTQHCWKNPH